ncbi:MAG: hypothetical protein H6920_08920 [Sphingomonadaceae bacterium]|nr:hypothetical protein [Sphingomonadaceae bacterium]MCP5384648.1 hypothetical protein [Altererythrobacter sp.]MCP5391727.1 hypothetical protein [Sphingomonadaceae bacterium]MCP5393841.1 hypothetical protein [Sphingomonadaceae bacterium]
MDQISLAAIAISIALGTLGLVFFYLIWDLAFFSRIEDDPVKGKIGATIAAYLTFSVLTGFLGRGDAAFDPSAFLYALVPAVIVGFFAWRKGMKLRARSAAESEFVDTFG